MVYCNIRQTEPAKTVLEDSQLPATDLVVFDSYSITVRGTFVVYGVYLYLAQDGRDNFPAMYIQTLNTDGGFDCHASEIAMYADKDVPHTELIVTLEFAREHGYPKARVVKRALECRLPSQQTLESIIHTLEPADAVTIAKLARR